VQQAEYVAQAFRPACARKGACNNGNASDNFQLYHSNAAVLPRPPAGCAPVTRAGINGLTCPIAAPGTPTLTAPTNLRIIR